MLEELEEIELQDEDEENIAPERAEDFGVPEEDIELEIEEEQLNG